MSHSGERRAAAILTEIDRTRGEMDRTLSAIEQRLSPQQLLNQGMDYVRRSGATEFVQNLGGAARQNPLPMALTGIGIAWLIALGRQPAQRDDHGSSAEERLTEGMNSAKHRASDKLTSLREHASAARESVTETTRRQWDRARGGFEYLVQEQPLLLGAIGLAVGAALGVSAPRTRQEERVMGETSRRMTEKAKEMGGEQLSKVRETVERAADAAQQSAEPNISH